MQMRWSPLQHVAPGQCRGDDTASAERVITSTSQEVEEQYELYDFYQPKQMVVIPPGQISRAFIRRWEGSGRAKSQRR